eukprot:g11706.t1
MVEKILILRWDLASIQFPMFIALWLLAASAKAGNCLDNDIASGPVDLTAVNGEAEKIGVPVEGTNGGVFFVSANGSFVFYPTGTGTGRDPTSVGYTVCLRGTKICDTARIFAQDTPRVKATAGVITSLGGLQLGRLLKEDGNSAATVTAVQGHPDNVNVLLKGSHGGTFALSSDGFFFFSPDGVVLQGQGAFFTTSINYTVCQPWHVLGEFSQQCSEATLSIRLPNLPASLVSPAPQFYDAPPALFPDDRDHEPPFARLARNNRGARWPRVRVQGFFTPGRPQLPGTHGAPGACSQTLFAWKKGGVDFGDIDNIRAFAHSEFRSENCKRMNQNIQSVAKESLKRVSSEMHPLWNEFQWL